MRTKVLCLLAALLLGIFHTGNAGAAEFTIPEEPTALDDGRITDQVIKRVGDTADLALVLYEDVKFDLSGVCLDTCQFQFAMAGGKLVLARVEPASRTSYVLEHRFERRAVSTPAQLNWLVRLELEYAPSKVLPRLKPGS